MSVVLVGRRLCRVVQLLPKLLGSTKSFALSPITGTPDTSEGRTEAAVMNDHSGSCISCTSVLVTRKDVPQKALDILKVKCTVEVHPSLHPISREDLLMKIKGKDALFCLLTDTIDKEVLDAAGPSLKVVGTMSVGFDHLDLSELKRRNIKVGYTPGVLTDATAELAVALLLATSRCLFEGHQELRNGGWAQCVWSPLFMVGKGLMGSTVGIFGLGRIGVGVVERLKGFRVKRFLYTGHSPKEEGDQLGAEFVTLDQLLTESDFVIITAALNDETKEIFNKDAFHKMKKTAILINVARGGLVDHEALVEALRSGEIHSAGLDVMTPEPLPLDHPLLSLSNCTLIPHMGSAEYSTREGMAILTAENILAALEDKPMPHQLC